MAAVVAKVSWLEKRINTMFDAYVGRKVLLIRWLVSTNPGSKRQGGSSMTGVLPIATSSSRGRPAQTQSVYRLEGTRVSNDSITNRPP